MSPESTCACLLCQVELRLLAEFNSPDGFPHGWLLASPDPLRQFSSVSPLLAALKSSQADPRSDELFRALFALDAINQQPVESLLVLAFVPLLHRTTRRVARHQRALSPDDIAQQALSILLAFFRSEQLRARTSHFAFAIARTLKRQMFEWAIREGSINCLPIETHGEITGAMTVEESFERHVLLRHFLHRCVTKGLLSDAEVDLLIQFKLDQHHENCSTAANSSNAVRQRLKRLLAKLRRLAQ